MKENKLIKLASEVGLNLNDSNRWDSLDIMKFLSHIEKKHKIKVNYNDINKLLINKFKPLLKKIK